MYRRCPGAVAPPGHTHPQLHRRLVDSGSVEHLAVRHRDVVLAHINKLGLRLNAGKSVLSPVQVTTFLGVVWDSTTMRAHLSPARVASILAAVEQVRLGQSLTVKQFQRLLGLLAAASNVIPSGLLFMRPLQWWLRTKGKPVPHDHCYAALSPHAGHVEEALVPNPGSRVGSSVSSCYTNDGCLPHRLGGDHEWSPSSRALAGPSAIMAHKLARDAGSLPGSEALPPRPKGSSCPCPVLLWSHGKLLSLRSIFIPGYLNQGADSLSRQGPRPGEWRLHPEVVELLWSHFGRAEVDLFASRETSHCPLWFSLPWCRHGRGHACTLSPKLLCSQEFWRGSVRSGSVQSTARSTVLAGPSMVCGPNISPRRLSSGDSDQEGPAFPGAWGHPSPPPGAVETMGLASEGARLLDSGLSTEVVETILHSRAPATRKAYAARWKLFTSWCRERQVDPVYCPVFAVLEFMQQRFSTGLSPSTLKVYVAALSTCHVPLNGVSLGRHPLVSRFLRGARRLRPAAGMRVPSWDLAIVLEGLSRAPFEPIEEVPDKFVTLKTVFLLAISSLKRIGDMQALSVVPSCLDFSPRMVKAFLLPSPGYVPKVPSNIVGPIVLQAFCPPPFLTSDQKKHNLLCPVRALDAYIHRTALWRLSEQLFVCFGPPKRGGPVSKQRMSKWVVEAISLAYESAGQPSPLAVRAHSTRSMEASKALLSGKVSLHDVCVAAGWSSPHTFVRFYQLDFSSTPGAQESRSSSKSLSPRGSRKSVSQSPAHSKDESHHSGSRSRSGSKSGSHRSSRRHYSRSRSRSHSRCRSSRSRSYSGDYRRRRSHSHSPMSNRRRHLGNRANPDPNCCLGVFGLSLYTTERDLREVFSKYGHMTDVSIVNDQQSRRSRGLAFVYFDHREDAKEAKERANGMELDGRRIRVDFAITKRPHTPTPGIYM
ncbi:hypothetical protein DPEC_G00135360 [Dallia pectoralis]|uniref:Uncharacterized protein n=1 Tax=Dallia pectoralis TaxID=75939 RepID=A0ACC2GL85_DALPE|nr:hypothetical protein DPEC_G00135360 [Dallia pectoralis]